MNTFSKRIKRYRRLRVVGGDTARIARKGGVKVMTYGEGIMGVSDSMLHQQRRGAGVATAFGAGNCGQNLDMALAIADGGPRRRSDPAFDGHEYPIGQWAIAIGSPSSRPGVWCRMPSFA